MFQREIQCLGLCNNIYSQNCSVGMHTCYCVNKYMKINSKTCNTEAYIVVMMQSIQYNAQVSTHFVAMHGYLSKILDSYIIENNINQQKLLNLNALISTFSRAILQILLTCSPFYRMQYKCDFRVARYIELSD